MTTTDDAQDTHQNEILASGAMLATLLGHGKVDAIEIVTDENGVPTNAVWVRFHFLKSRYRVTVTMDPEEGDPRG